MAELYKKIDSDTLKITLDHTETREVLERRKARWKEQIDEIDAKLAILNKET